MKNVYLLAAALLLSVGALVAQVPTGFTFEGVARDANGQVKASSGIKIQITLLPQGSQQKDWRQTFSTKTDKYGVFTVIVGQEKATTDETWTANLENSAITFDKLNWTSTRYEMFVEDITGTQSITVGRSPLASVPYATVAQNVINENDPKFAAAPAATIKATDTTRWATDNDKQTLALTNNTLAISNGNSVNLAPYAVDNDKQTLTLTGNELSISGAASKIDLSNLTLKQPIVLGSLNKKLSGKVAMVNGNPVAQGFFGTKFTTELQPGMPVSINSVKYTVLSIKSDNEMTLDVAPTADINNSDYYTDGTMFLARSSSGDTLASITNNGRYMDATGYVMPVGSIIPFAGETVPKGWLRCDGSILKRADYSELFAAIGTAWGTTANDNFRLPHTQGVFLRGWDINKETDKEASNRLALYGDGIAGNHVGSVQFDAFQGHWHDIFSIPGENVWHDYVTSGTYDTKIIPFVGNYQYRSNPYQAKTIIGDGINDAPRTSSETRPVNVYVNYIIKY